MSFSGSGDLLDPDDDDDDDDDEGIFEADPIGYAITGVVGLFGAVLVALFLCLCICACYKCRKKSQSSKQIEMTASKEILKDDM